jgi:hypothetical protein
MQFLQWNTEQNKNSAESYTLFNVFIGKSLKAISYFAS